MPCRVEPTALNRPRSIASSRVVNTQRRMSQGSRTSGSPETFSCSLSPADELVSHAFKSRRQVMAGRWRLQLA